MFEVIQGPVLDLAESIQGALLYLDAGAGEIAQTTLGLPFLLGLGVSHVCSLETASPADSAFPLLATGCAPTHLAVFTTQLLTDVHHHILRAVLAHPAAVSVSVFTSVSEHAHACQAASELGVEAFREYADHLQHDVRRARAAAAQQSHHAQAPSALGTVVGSSPPGVTVSVRVALLPLLACCLDPGLFVLPAASSAARRAVAGGLAAGFAPPEPDTAGSATTAEGASGGLSLMAHGLLALSAAMGAPRPEPYAIGPVSCALAAELASLPSVSITPNGGSGGLVGGGGAGSASSSLALILVDRCLDLASPCAHSDHPWDLLLAATAARQAAKAAAQAAATARTAGRHGGGGDGRAGLQTAWRPLDLRAALPAPADAVPLDVPWLPDAAANSSLPAAAAGLLHSNLPYGQLSYETYGVELLDPTDRTAISRLEAMAGRPRRDALAALRRGLKEALRAEKLTPAVRSKAGAVQAPELRGLAEPLVATSGACNRQRGIAALGLAVAEALTSPAAAEWEAAAGLERSVLAAMSGAGGSGGNGSGDSGGGGCEAAVQVLLDALTAAKCGRGLLHVGHVLEVLPAAFSAAPDSDTTTTTTAGTSSASSAASGGAGGSGACPFSPKQQAALRHALAESVLSCGVPRTALGGRLPADLVAALAARRQRRGRRRSKSADGDASREDGTRGDPADAGDPGVVGSGTPGPATECEGGDEDEAAVERRLGTVLDGLFAGLRYAAVARERLKTFKRVTHVDVFAENHGSLSPLLRQVVRRVMQRADVTDWQQQPTSSGGGGLVRGLLGGLMGASRALVGRAAAGGGGGGPLPGDCGTVLVFVVGGISATEVREVRAELEEHVVPGKPRVLLGGTSLLLPQDVTLQLAGGPLLPSA